jgi:hypothetical protein
MSGHYFWLVLKLILLFNLTAKAVDSRQCYKLLSKTPAEILPKIWSNLSWNLVDLIECNQVNRISFSEHKELLKQSTKHDINLRITILDKEMETSPLNAKATFFSSCDDDHPKLMTLIKNGKPFSISIALTQTRLKQNLLWHVKQIKELASFYLLDMERQVPVRYLFHFCSQSNKLLRGFYIF